MPTRVDPDRPRQARPHPPAAAGDPGRRGTGWRRRRSPRASSYGSGAGMALAVAGGIMLLLGLARGLVACSIHLDVEEAAVRVRGSAASGSTPWSPDRSRAFGVAATRRRRRAALRRLGWRIGRGPPPRRGGRSRSSGSRPPRRRSSCPPTVVAWPSPRQRGDLLKALSRAARARQRAGATARRRPSRAAATASEPVVEPDGEPRRGRMAEPDARAPARARSLASPSGDAGC